MHLVCRMYTDVSTILILDPSNVRDKMCLFVNASIVAESRSYRVRSCHNLLHMQCTHQLLRYKIRHCYTNERTLAF